MVGGGGGGQEHWGEGGYGRMCVWGNWGGGGAGRDRGQD